MDKGVAATNMQARAAARAAAVEKARVEYATLAEGGDPNRMEAKGAAKASASRGGRSPTPSRRLSSGQLVSSVLSTEESLLEEKLEAIPFLGGLEFYTTRCDRAYLDALARWHTALLLLCQPHPAIGSHHAIDLEQHVQCLWCSLMIEFAAAAAFASRRTDDEYFTQSAVVDGLLAALVGVPIALLGVRAIFVLCGPAGRVRHHDGTPPARPRGFDVAVEFLNGRYFCHSLGGNAAFMLRWLRASLGWVVAWSVFVVAAVVAARRAADLDDVPLRRTFASWAFAQLASWLLVEPVGVFALVSVLRLGRCLSRHWERARTVPLVSPTKARRAAGAQAMAEAKQLAVADHVSEPAAPEDVPQMICSAAKQSTAASAGARTPQPLSTSRKLTSFMPRMPSSGGAGVKYQVEPPRES